MKRNPATVATAKGLLRAVRGVKRAKAAVARARRAVNRKAKPRKVRSVRDRLIDSAMRKLGNEFPREFLEEVVREDGRVARPRNMPEDIWGPVSRALGTERRATGGARRPPPADEAERYAREEERREFFEQVASHRLPSKLRRELIGNPGARTVRAAGRRLALRLRGRELVGVEGPGAKAVRDGIALFRKWSRRDPGSVDVVRVPAGTPPVLVALGELTDVGYRSNKWGGKHHLYIHRTKPPRPVLCATPDGRRVVILGGGMTVRPEGLVG